ncbi:MAG: trypsin-like peptidase domain-containing protein [Frankia sp.]|nr:trypsin-like peptidase domain-containing protein [Frankia sp.]
MVAGLLGGLVGGAVGARLAGSGESGSSLRLGGSAPAGGAPGSVADVVAAVLPSVVTIDVRGAEGSTGSGVIIRSDGYILTNSHVIAPALRGEGQLMVTLYKEVAQIPAQVVGQDARTDLAVIKISTGTELPAAVLGRSGSLRVGTPVIAIGAPLGLSGTVTTGIVSALDRNPTVPVASGESPPMLVGAIQIDAALNFGSSGGPLLDTAGQVVGINSAIASIPGTDGTVGQTGNSGVGFAIPIDYAASVADEIIRTGRATHPHFGVVATTVTPQEADAAGTAPGAKLREVTPGGPAAGAGLRVGDIVTKVDDMVIASSNDLLAAARLHEVGDRVTVTYQRAGRSASLQVTLAEQPG